MGAGQCPAIQANRAPTVVTLSVVGVNVDDPPEVVDLKFNVAEESLLRPPST